MISQNTGFKELHTPSEITAKAGHGDLNAGSVRAFGYEVESSTGNEPNKPLNIDQSAQFNEIPTNEDTKLECQPNLNRHKSAGKYFDGESLAEEYVNELIE